MNYRIYILSFFYLLLSGSVFSQDQPTEQPQGEVVDEVIAIVGSNIILKSDIEAQYIQYRMQQGGAAGSESTVKCSILESMLRQKLLLSQGELDSVEVSDMQVESEMDRRLRYYIKQFGSQEKLEEFYQQSIFEIKDEFRDLIKQQMMMETVQNSITADVTITPSEVRKFYRDIPKDSLPLINSEVELMQIVKKPPINPEERERIRKKLLELRKRVLNGESFATLAILYSEDPGSAKNGGELGFVGRGELYPEFEAVAFNLKEGEVSDILETEAGFHIIQMIERRGDYVNVRHILLQPKVSPLDLMKAKKELDSISQLIEDGKYTFEEAVAEFSDDPSKNNGGLLINPNTGTSVFEADQLDAKVFFVIDKLKVGEISAPVPFKTDDNKDAYRILYLKKRTEPHKANLKDDYDKIQQWALEQKKQQVIQKWMAEKIDKTFIKINDEYKDCKFSNNWFKD